MSRSLDGIVHRFGSTLTPEGALAIDPRGQALPPLSDGDAVRIREAQVTSRRRMIALKNATLGERCDIHNAEPGRWCYVAVKGNCGERVAAGRAVLADGSTVQTTSAEKGRP